MKNLYQIKETCPLWSDGTGEPYERILSYVFTDRDMAEKYVSELYDLTNERVDCLEYKIVVSRFNLVENYMTFGEYEKYLDTTNREDQEENDRDSMFVDRDYRTFNKIYYGGDD